MSGYSIEIFVPAHPSDLHTIEKMVKFRDFILNSPIALWPEGTIVYAPEWKATSRRKSAPPVPAERPTVAEAGDNAAHAAESPAIDLTIPAELRRA